MAAYEELIEASGGFGHYQVFLLFWYTLVILVMAAQNSFMVFGAMHAKLTDAEAAANATGLQFYSIVDEFQLYGQSYRVGLSSFCQSC